MSINPYNKISESKIDIIKDVFSKIEDEYNNIESSYREGEEKIYVIDIEDDKCEIVYEYDQDDSHFIQNGDGNLASRRGINQVEDGEIIPFVEVPYYAISMSLSEDALRRNKSFFRDIKNCIIQVQKLTGMSLHENGDLFFKNGIELYEESYLTVDWLNFDPDSILLGKEMRDWIIHIFLKD